MANVRDAWSVRARRCAPIPGSSERGANSLELAPIAATTDRYDDSDLCDADRPEAVSCGPTSRRVRLCAFRTSDLWLQVFASSALQPRTALVA